MSRVTHHQSEHKKGIDKNPTIKCKQCNTLWCTTCIGWEAVFLPTEENETENICANCREKCACGNIAGYRSLIFPYGKYHDRYCEHKPCSANKCTTPVCEDCEYCKDCELITRNMRELDDATLKYECDHKEQKDDVVDAISQALKKIETAFFPMRATILKLSATSMHISPEYHKDSVWSFKTNARCLVDGCLFRNPYESDDYLCRFHQSRDEEALREARKKQNEATSEKLKDYKPPSELSIVVNGTTLVFKLQQF